MNKVTIDKTVLDELIKAASMAAQTLVNILPNLPDGFLVDVCIHDLRVLRDALAKASP